MATRSGKDRSLACWTNRADGPQACVRDVPLACNIPGARTLFLFSSKECKKQG